MKNKKIFNKNILIYFIFQLKNKILFIEILIIKYFLLNQKKIFKKMNINLKKNFLRITILTFM
jgi:hypothetical protein